MLTPRVQPPSPRCRGAAPCPLPTKRAPRRSHYSGSTPRPPPTRRPTRPTHPTPQSHKANNKEEKERTARWGHATWHAARRVVIRGRAALGLPARRARRVALSARPRARSCCARPPPARGRSEGAARARSDGRDGRRAREEETTAARANGPARLRRREPPTATHARRARRALVPRRPPRPRSAWSGGRREDARRGRRQATTGRAKSKRRKDHRGVRKRP